MNRSDINAVFIWWFVLFLFGVGFLPITFRLFAPFFDKCYLFSKLIGLLLVGYVVFVLGAFHIAPFTIPVIVITALVLAGGSFYLLKEKWKILYDLQHK